MRKVLVLSIAVLFVAAIASSRKDDQRKDLRLQLPNVEAPKIETARLFSPSIDRFDVTNSVNVSQPPAVNWPEAPKPLPEKRSAPGSSEARQAATIPATKKPAPKKQAAKDPKRAATPHR